MEIRIDIASEGTVTVVFITGRLSGAAVTQLGEACDQIEDAFVLDLSNLRSVDAAGINFIRTLDEKETEIRGASPFIQLLLDDSSGE
jgi:anti-anti-sigma regulatory factor